MSFCSKCGQEINDSDMFCDSCGTKVTNKSKKSAAMTHAQPSGGFLSEYVNMWKNYANFKDRTTRKGYWMASLYNSLIVFCSILVMAFIESANGGDGELTDIISGLYQIAIIIPSLSIWVRRLRDAGKHWANIFWVFLPIIGWVVIIIHMCQKSKPDDGTPVV